ncbi:MAG: hypothetical protein KTR31_35570 [Myxococcales bacterium]|nr:hypothetical protein [Myxococcales bacterium]
MTRQIADLQVHERRATGWYVRFRHGQCWRGAWIPRPVVEAARSQGPLQPQLVQVVDGGPELGSLARELLEHLPSVPPADDTMEDDFGPSPTLVVDRDEP